jgi:hypothetical protein
MGAVRVDMGAVAPFRDSMEDGGSVHKTGNNHAYQKKPNERPNDT